MAVHDGAELIVGVGEKSAVPVAVAGEEAEGAAEGVVEPEAEVQMVGVAVGAGPV